MKKELGDMDILLKLCRFCKDKCSNPECKLVVKGELDMPDITMCNNEDCSKKKTCYRYMAKPNEYRQSWFSNITEEECDVYWEICSVEKESEE